MVKLTQEQRDRLYARTFDSFVRTRNIDEDDEYWTDEDNAAWEERLAWLKSMGW